MVSDPLLRLKLTGLFAGTFSIVLLVIAQRMDDRQLFQTAQKRQHQQQISIEPPAAPQTLPPPQPEYPRGINYASRLNGGLATGGKDTELLIDGNETDYSGGTGFAMTVWSDPKQFFTLTFKEPSMIDNVQFLLWDRAENRFYRYKIEVSPDDKNDNWKLLVDNSGPTVECKSWQTIRFTPQFAQRIRLTGTFNSANAGFHVVEVKASFGSPQSRQPDDPDF